MALTLEITRADGVVESKALTGAEISIDTQAGDRFRLLNENGQPVEGLNAIREGDSLVIEGLPDTARLELCDFYEVNDKDGECVLTLPEAELSSSSADPLLVAQNTAATKTDAAMDKAAEMKEGAEAAAEKAADAKASMADKTDDAKASMADKADEAKASMADKAGDAKAAATEQAGNAEAAATDTAPTATVEEAAGVSAEESSGNSTLQTAGIALGAIALVGLAASGSSSSSENIDIVPTATPTANLEGGNTTIDGTEASNGFTVTGTAAAGNTVVVMIGTASVETVADSSGNYSVEFTGSELPADGNHAMTVTSTDPTGATSPSTATIGDVTVAVGGTALNTTDADSATITGFDSGDVLIGGNDPGLSNGNFQEWDLGSYGEGVATAGHIFDATTSIPAGSISIQVDTVTNSTYEHPTFGGWSMVAANTPGVTGIGNVGVNGYDEGAGVVSNQTRIEFITTTQPGEYEWETVTSETSGGSGLTQSVTTVAEQSYSLSMDTGVPTGTDSSSHATGGTSLEIRWGGDTVAFYDATEGAQGAWVTTGGLLTPTVDGNNWTFDGLSASADTTDLTIIAYEQWNNGGTTAFNDGVGLRLSNIELTGEAGATAQTIVGGAGNDSIYGQGGDDTLYGGAMNTADTVTDHFVYNMMLDNGNDVIMDFDINNDVIYLTNVADANSTNSQYMGDTRQFTNNIGGAEDNTGTLTDESTSSAGNLTADDLLVTGEQSIAVTEVAGSTVLTFTGNGGEAMGSVTLQGVTGLLDTDDSTTINAMITDGTLSLTGSAFDGSLPALPLV